MASSSSSTQGEWEYDVFLCFRGDIGNKFLSHLHQAMLDKNIRVFIDTMLHVTQDMGELLRILQRTAVSVVIFSSQFADSSLCLDEVHTVAQCVQNWRHRALPIFYNVDWTTVAGDYNCYAKTIAGLDATQKRKDEWMKSLKVVASKTGRTSESFPVEAGLIEEVVSQILTKLATMSSAIEFNNLVGMASRISEVDRLLAMDATDDAIRIVGLWGMGGLGKSVLARACYERLKGLHREEMKFHFVDKINETCDKQYLIEGLVHEMYSTLLSESYLTWDDVGVDYRRARLCRLKVFVVLDDVQTPSQLEQFFLGEALSLVKLFAAGSRIIITTRNQRVINYVKAEMYPVEHLNDVQSLQLFKMHAFQPAGSVQDDDRIRINDLSRKVVAYCKGNPLALTVLGGRLLPKDKTYWESFLCKLGKIQLPGIYRVLKRSYDELGDDDKRLFLDVACFFHGIWKTSLVKYMGTSYSSSYSRIEDLTGKSLLISEKKIQGEVVVVHSLLREMAWNIVNEEENTGKRSRLNDPRDIHYLLTVREGDRATQGIQLDLSKAENMDLKANAFIGMDSLRWLDFAWPKCVELGNRKIKLVDGELRYLPNELRGLYWDQFPSSSLPPAFSPQKLAYLVVSHSPIEKCWKRDQLQPKLEYLMLLSLSNCENLTTIPNLTSCSNLELLLLRGCKSLIDLPAAVQSLVKLVSLDARDCQNLKSVPSRLNSKSLKQLLLSNCPNLTRCPEVNSVQLQALDLDGTPINSLPNAIYKVTEKGMVSLYGPCITLSPQIATRLGLLGLRQTAIANFELDCNGGRLDKFDRMHLIQNAQLTTLPTSVWNKVSDELIIEDCPLIGCLPVISEPYSHSLTVLRIARCPSIAEFPPSICKLRFLEVLAFVGTAVKSLPCCIGELVQLSHLDISYSRDLESVPSTINELAKLSELLLTGCGSLESLPELLPPNLIVLKANDCVSLRALSQNIRNLNLQHLSLDGCPLLEKYLVDEIVANFPDQQGELCNDDPDQQGELCNDDRELLDRDSCGMLVSMEMDFDCY
ncbi:Disease resistance-like protein DSC1 [Linum perenne]